MSVTSGLNQAARVHLRWLQNTDRARALCDMLEAAGGPPAQRALFATFGPENQALVEQERWRRSVNAQAPVGSFVGPKDERAGFEIVQRGEGSTLSAVYAGTATVIGQADGMFKRYLLLHVPWQDREGRVMQFVEASAHELVTHWSPSIKRLVV